MIFVFALIFLGGLTFWSIIIESLASRFLLLFKRTSPFGRVLFYDTGLDRNKMHFCCKHHDCASCKFYEKNCKGFLNND